MPYYAYLAYNEGLDPNNRWATYGRKPIAIIDFVKRMKDGKQRLEKLIERHSDLLPAEGWKDRILHRKVDTDDNRVIERLKKEIRLKMATKSLLTTGERRLWARTPGAPAGCYRLPFYEANDILLSTLRQSGLYNPGAS